MRNCQGHVISAFVAILITLISIFFVPLTVHAGNPLYMNPNGSPLVWDTSEPIRYVVDAKGLGKLSFEQSLALIREATRIWESVTGTGIEFEFAGTTDQPISLTNWKSISGNTLYAEGYNVVPSGTVKAQTEHLLVIGFDNTGEIIEDKGSDGASGVQSLTGVKGTLENPEFIISSHVFINGLYHNGTNEDITDLSLTDLLAIVVHELGHALGLDHNVFHYEIYQQIIQGTLDWRYARYLPTMFPRFIKTTGEHAITLHPDDIATLKWMYGSNDVTFMSGEVLDSNYQPVSSMLVTARETSSSLCHAYAQATSATCADMNTSANGTGVNQFNAKNCINDNYTGYYDIPVLQNGYYTLDVQEVPEFLSTSIAKLGSNVLQIPGGAEFYNDDDAASDTSEYLFDEIRVEGQDEDELDIVLASSAATSGHLERIEYEYFSLNDFFELVEDDSECPLSYEYDSETNILNADVSDMMTSVNAEDLENIASSASSTSASSCSLQTQSSHAERSSNRNLPLMLVFMGLILTARWITQTNSAELPARS